MNMPETIEVATGNIYCDMVERAPVVMAIIQNGRFYYANPAAASFLGYSLDELNQTAFLDTVAEDDKERIAELCSLVAAHSTTSNGEMKLLRKDGRTRALEMTLSGITVEANPAVQLIGWDSSDHKQRCEQLVLSEKLAALGRFVSAVAHELNNPLTVIVGFADILSSNLKLEGQNQADLQMISIEADRARRMIHELLTLSRPLPLQPRSVPLNQLLATFLDNHKVSFQDHQIAVTTDFDPALPSIQADPDQLEEAFTHLMTYIRKSLSEQTNRQLRVSTSVNRDLTGRQTVQLTLADNSSLQSLDTLRQIFEPTYTSREEDHGLGLAMSYKLLQQNGSHLSVTSEPDQGVKFLIEFPVDRERSS